MIANLKSIVESLVFVSETPLSLNRLKAILGDVDLRDIRLVLAELQGEYEDRQGGFALKEVAGGYQFRTRSAYSDWIKKLLKPSPTRLSRAALETLAIIAYKQPIIRADIEHIRGVDSGGVLRLLLEKKLIRVLGRKDIPGRPMIYGTTKDFLEIFNLKDLSELPSPKEITSLGSPDRDDARDEAMDVEDVNTLAELSEGPSPTGGVSQETEMPAERVLSTDAVETEGTDFVMTPGPSAKELPSPTASGTAEDELSHFETSNSMPTPPDDLPDGERSTPPADQDESKA